MQRQQSSPREHGFTLVELLVYMLLSVLVLAIVGTLMVNTMRVQRSVTGVTSANNAAQSVVNALEIAVRNADPAGIDVVPGSGAGSFVLKVANLQRQMTGSPAAPETWQCSYFLYDGNGSVWQRHSVTPVLSFPSGDHDSGVYPAGWSFMLDSLAPDPGGPFTVDTDPTGQTQVHVTLPVESGTSGPGTTLTTTVLPLTRVSAGALSC